MFKIEVPKNNIPMNFVDLGHQGEGNTSYVLFDLQHFIDELGEGTWEVVNLRPGEEMPYLVANTDELIDQETGIAKAMWILDETDMAIAGEGRVELRYYPTDGTAKTDVYRTRILPSLGVSSEDPPDPYDDWLDRFADLSSEASASASAAKASEQLARTAAESAEESASAAEISASSADGSAEAANASAAAAAGSATQAQAYAQASAAHSGGDVLVTDMRDNAQYKLGFVITENGDPAIALTEVEA